MSRRRIGYVVTLCMLALSASVSLAGLEFGAVLTSAQEVPTPVPGLITSSEIEVRFDAGLTEAKVKLKIKGGSAINAAHFHCALPGRAGPVAVDLLPTPLVVSGDTAEGTIDVTAFRAVDCVPHINRPVNTIAALAFAMREGLIYANVHTPANPPGEVRGQMLEVTKDGKAALHSSAGEEAVGVQTNGRVELGAAR